MTNTGGIDGKGLGLGWKVKEMWRKDGRRMGERKGGIRQNGAEKEGEREEEEEWAEKVNRTESREEE